MRNLELSLLFRFRDQGSAVAKRAAKDIEATAKETAKVSTAAAKQEADAHISLWRRVTESRKTLGIRSEQEIQSEIRRTQSAYQALAQSGTLSAREQARALKAMKDQVRELNRELKGGSGLMQRMGGVGRGAISMGAGVMAAGYVLKQPLDRAMSYDRRLAGMANTAYSDRNTVGRRAGMADLNTAIVGAVRTGGGTREQAAETLDSLIASGALGEGKEGIGNAIKLLPTLQKYSTATGADPEDLANIAIRAKQSFGIGIDQMPLALDMAIKAGQEGGFELKDMAKWLPQQMAAGRNIGLSGLGGLGKLLAANQSSVITAGTKDEAGNNLVNLLAKINSADTAKDAQKAGINLPGTLAKARENGMDGLDAFVGIVDRVVGKNKQYQALQSRLAQAKGSDREATLSSMTDIMQGSSIGQIVQDRQALMALVGYMNNRDYVKNIEAALPNAGGTGQSNFDLISDTASFKTERLGNEKAIAEQNLFSPLSEAVGDVAGKLADYAQHYPGLSSALVAATTGLTALAAAAGASGLASLATGGGAGLVARVAGAAAPLAGSAAAVGSAALPWVAGAAAAGGAGYLVGTGINHGINSAIKMGTGDQDQTLGGWIYDLLHREENARLNQPIQLQVQLDGRVIAEAVNDHNGTQAGRS